MAGESGGDLSLRYLAELIEKYRIETREARHDHANKVQVAIAELDRRMDARLRAIEVDIAASAPTTLGPRINNLEREMARLDGDAPGGAPKRINDLEAWRDRIEGTTIALKVGVAILSVVNVLLGIFVAVQALS